MKNFFLLIAIVFCTVTINAQNKRNAAYGIKAGGNFYTINGKDFDDPGFKINWVFTQGHFTRFLSGLHSAYSRS